MCVYKPAYALNELVISIEFIETHWPLDQMNIDST